MDQQAFDLLMARFDKIEEMIGQHIEDDQEVAKEVARHSTYWKVTMASVPPILGYFLAKLGFK